MHDHTLRIFAARPVVIGVGQRKEKATARAKRIHEGKGAPGAVEEKKKQVEKGSTNSSMSRERMEEEFEQLVKQIKEAENNKHRHGCRIQNQHVIGGNHRRR